MTLFGLPGKSWAYAMAIFVSFLNWPFSQTPSLTFSHADPELAHVGATVGPGLGALTIWLAVHPL
eukprot:CAMPEP_0179029664 /NCGR_PEP_ID=MMETSP0796-20121207/10174_1 /TAXON_ID=73915 /ORGANISM="Pyrodinium bahamense, Strain pbaha01" /LENGTH=64 /DNA_ID=CAMNT_0020725837 /DNA_START=243 /DNA_END=434 /DNA_ORIENTATION=-